MTTNEEEFDQVVFSKRLLFSLLKKIIFNPDQNIIAKQEKVNFFLIILEGEQQRIKTFFFSLHLNTLLFRGGAAVSKKPSSNESSVEVTLSRENSYFPALLIFFDSPSRVTTKAKKQAKCICMDRQSFHDIVVSVLKYIERNTQVYKNMYEL
jgi:hypothetical protein